MHQNLTLMTRSGKQNLAAPSESDRVDAAIIRRCRLGDENAWNELVDRYQRLVFAVPRRAGLGEEQAADIFQEVFLTLFQKLDELERPEKVRSWIVTTAKFKTWAAVRSAKGFYSPASDEEMEREMESIRDSSPLADEILIELEQQHLIRAGMLELDERCREILTMLYLHANAASYAEVAARINVGETSVSPLRTRCLKKLEKIISG